MKRVIILLAAVALAVGSPGQTAKREVTIAAAGMRNGHGWQSWLPVTAEVTFLAASRFDE